MEEKMERSQSGAEGRSEGGIKHLHLFFHNASVLHSVGRTMEGEGRERTVGRRKQ